MATKKEEKNIVVNIPSLDLQVATIKIKGTNPLVTNPFSLKQMRQIEEKQHGVAKAKKHDIRNEWQDLIESIYWLSDTPTEYTKDAFDAAVVNGRYGFAVGGVKDSAIQAAYRRGLVKNAVTGRGLFQILGTEQDRIYQKQCVEIITPEPPQMRVDCLSTFNSGADMRYRPQFNEWRMEFQVMFDAGVLSLDQLCMWFQLGGFACGLGENRAEKGEGWGSYILDM